MTTPHVAPPPERFNFARHLIALNTGRANKTALIDDQGTLTYGELADQVQRFAGALTALGLRREERVLLLMHDSSDWVVAFLGALHAGVVPVAVNTLLTAQDYTYMLANSRAQAALVSAALLPTLQTALASRPTEVKHLIVSRANEPLPARCARFLHPGRQQRTRAAGRHARRRARVLALFKRLHRRPPKGTRPHPGQPSTGQPSCTARVCLDCTSVTWCSPPPNCFSRTDWATR